MCWEIPKFVFLGHHSEESYFKSFKNQNPVKESKYKLMHWIHSDKKKILNEKERFKTLFHIQYKENSVQNVRFFSNLLGYIFMCRSTVACWPRVRGTLTRTAWPRRSPLERASGAHRYSSTQRYERAFRQQFSTFLCQYIVFLGICNILVQHFVQSSQSLQSLHKKVRTLFETLRKLKAARKYFTLIYKFL